MSERTDSIVERRSLRVTGMADDSSAVVEASLAKLAGMVSADAATGRVDVEYDAGILNVERIRTALEEAGFGLEGEDESESRYVAVGPAAIHTGEFDRVTLPVEGMTCANCTQAVGKAISAVPGVEEVTVNLVLDQAAVIYDGQRASPEQMVASIKRAGYDVPESALPEIADASLRKDLYKLLISAALTLPLVAPMVLMLFGVAWELNAWLQLALATPVQFWIGARFYSGAWHAIRNRTGNMDVLVATGTSAAWGFSLLVLLSDAFGDGQFGDAFYFESAAVIITMVLLGKWLEKRARRTSGDAIRSLMALQPETASQLVDGEITEIPVSRLWSGDLVVVRPGERIPVDGLVREGATDVDESLVTGESLPVRKEEGAQVIGGAINGSGRVVIEVTATGEDAALSRIIQMVAGAQASRAPVQQLADRLAAIFVPVVLGIAVLTFALWMLGSGDLTYTVMAAVSVIVISCPCALGLATPAALAAGTAVAARAGILIRDVEALERMHGIDRMVFDKTGTLTVGHPSVTDIFPEAGVDATAMLRLVASAQQGSEHPLGRAIISRAQDDGLSLAEPTDFESFAGQGIAARIDGQAIIVGTEGFLSECGIVPASDGISERLEGEGKSIMWVGSTEPETRMLGILAVADSLKEKAADAVSSIEQLGVTPVIMSGDSEGAVNAIAAAVNVTDYRHRMRPEDKAQAVSEMQGQGHSVAMIGDGVNDAPALAAADVGVAMGTGTDIAMETAGITLLHGDPALLPGSIGVSRATWRKIRQNLFWAFAYNVVCIPLAASGFLTPAIAGTAMALSSLSVVTNASLLHRWKPGI